MRGDSEIEKNLSYWLNYSPRTPNPYLTFSLIDIYEDKEVCEEVQNHLKNILLKCRFPEGLLDDIAKYIGYDAIAEKIILQNLPTILTFRRGYFGEALIGEILVQIFDYIIPVQKFQYAIIANQSLPRTDIIVIKKNKDEISEICFVESKLRTINDTTAAVDAFNQLKIDYSKEIPDLMFFILCRLQERKEPLFLDFLKYMFDPRDTSDIEKFIIGLVYDVAYWSETTLKNLDDEIKTNSNYNIIIKLVKINDLALLIDNVYDRIGIYDVIDDD